MSEPRIRVRNLTMAYGDFVIQRDLDFDIQPGEIFAIMGGSGCGKSTLMRHLIGLKRPAQGEILYDGVDFWAGEEDERQRTMQRFGVLYQSGALWSSMTLAENIAIPLEEYTALSSADIRELASLKLALGGTGRFRGLSSVGDQRRDAQAGRAGPRHGAGSGHSLFFDEPSAGLDPVTSHRLDELILELRDSLGATVVIVTHELPSIFAVCDNSVFLDPETKTMIASGNPKTMLAETTDNRVREFLTRGAE